MNCGKQIFKSQDSAMINSSWFLGESGKNPETLDQVIENILVHLKSSGIALRSTDCSTKDEIAQMEQSIEILIDEINNVFNKLKSSPKYKRKLGSIQGDIKSKLLEQLTESNNDEINDEQKDLEINESSKDTHKLTLSNMTSEVFEDNTAAQLYWQHNFESNISVKIIIDPDNKTESLRYVDNEITLNKQIQSFKEEQYAKLREYLLEEYPNIPKQIY